MACSNSVLFCVYPQFSSLYSSKLGLGTRFWLKLKVAKTEISNVATKIVRKQLGLDFAISKALSLNHNLRQFFPPIQAKPVEEYFDENIR